MSPKDAALTLFTRLFGQHDADGVKALLAEDYIQHNPAVPTGREAVLSLIPMLRESGLHVEVHRTLAEDNLVVLHSTYTNVQAFGLDTLVAFNVFRVDDGKIVEHWDNLQPMAPDNVSGRSMVDGADRITDRDKTAENKALVELFIADVLEGAAPAKIADYVSTDTYYQHNPEVGDGLAALEEVMQQMQASGRGMQYKKTHILIAEGNFVFAASDGLMGDAPTAFYDLFRLENGKIVEHWDCIAEIPASMAHGNGKFEAMGSALSTMH